MNRNRFGQPVGQPLPDWTPPPYPVSVTLEGRWCRVEPLADHHAEDLYAANGEDLDGRMWTYMGYGPFDTLEAYQTWLQGVLGARDPLFFALIDTSGRAAGVASYLRIAPASGSLEVGHIALSPRLQGTAAATEAQFLLMKHAFGLGYRRYEWKCDALNAASRRAAQRLGFSYEGTFYQATVYKGRNRDTAWYALLDSDWPALQQAFEHWLAPEQFGGDGRQRERLSALTLPLLRAQG